MKFERLLVRFWGWRRPYKPILADLGQAKAQLNDFKHALTESGGRRIYDSDGSANAADYPSLARHFVASSCLLLPRANRQRPRSDPKLANLTISEHFVVWRWLSLLFACVARARPNSQHRNIMKT